MYSHILFYKNTDDKPFHAYPMSTCFMPLTDIESIRDVIADDSQLANEILQVELHSGLTDSTDDMTRILFALRNMDECNDFWSVYAMADDIRCEFPICYIFGSPAQVALNLESIRDVIGHYHEEGEAHPDFDAYK